MAENTMPVVGGFYRHFKNRLYQVLHLAVDANTEEPLVVYQALYGDFKVYVRPLKEFISEVDHEKYPDVKQKYRFEQVEMAESPAGEPAGKTDHDLTAASVDEPGSEQELSPLLLPFVEADSIDRQLELLMAMTGKIGQRELDILYVALDLPQRGGSVEEQIHAIRQYLEMQKRFDGGRLR